jgi:hypothetical protein
VVLLLYALAVVVPPLALLLCRKWWQGVVAWLAIVTLGATLPGGWGPFLVYPPVALWALFAVDRRVAPGQAARRIREAWAGDQGARVL